MAGDRAYYNLKDDRLVLPERSQFPSVDAYTHTALHELGHATGHPSRLNRPTLVDHGGFGTETYAREELRAEIAAMMTGEQLGVGHEPRHGTAYVSSWIKALENDPKEYEKPISSSGSIGGSGCGNAPPYPVRLAGPVEPVAEERMSCLPLRVCYSPYLTSSARLSTQAGGDRPGQPGSRLN